MYAYSSICGVFFKNFSSIANITKKGLAAVLLLLLLLLLVVLLVLLVLLLVLEVTLAVYCSLKSCREVEDSDLGIFIA